MRQLLLPFSLLLTLAACSPETANIKGRRELSQPEAPKVPKYDPVTRDEVRWISLDGGQSKLDFNPKVDILFVIDNSESMKSAQENLSRNINRFVDAFQKNKMIDYHMGVISVWDSSERFKTTKKDPYQIGELRRLKNADGQTSEKRFAYRFNGVEAVMAATLKIGIAPYAEGGPENEEMFSPLSAALRTSSQKPETKDFFRDDAQLVVVMISDADDLTADISPSQMAQELINFKGGQRDRVSAYGALVKKSDPDSVKDWGLRVDPRYHKDCFDITTDRNGKTVSTKDNGTCKGGFGPERIEQFILEANSASAMTGEFREQHIMSLIQKDFGQDLAKIGSDISAKVLAKEILLPERPAQNADGSMAIRVRYGKPEVLAQDKTGKKGLIPQQTKGGWQYDPENNSVRLSGDIVYAYEEGARFVVDMMPVTIRK